MAVPGLLIVIVEGELVAPTFVFAKVMDVGLTVICGTVPVPVRVTVCGLPLALSTKVSVAERVPAAPAVNVTGIEMLALGWTVIGNPLGSVNPKSLADVPVSVTEVIVKTPAPLFVTTRLTGVAEVPTGWLPKLMVDALKVTLGPTPVPLRGIVSGLPVAL